MPDFPSGEWVGFYTYASRPRRYLMDLVLTFQNGVIRGTGTDGIGEFVINGGYNSASGDCDWVKTYLGKHSVEYRGFREGKGIWGTWSIGRTTGGFQIWPIGQSSESLTTTEEEALELERVPEIPNVSVANARVLSCSPRLSSGVRYP